MASQTHLAAMAVLAILVIYMYWDRRRKTEKTERSRMYRRKARFMPDAYNWPQDRQFGATAETFPYGNYSGDVAKPYSLY